MKKRSGRSHKCGRNHTTVIDAAALVIDHLKKCDHVLMIYPGWIKQSKGSSGGGRSMKVRNTTDDRDGFLQIMVNANGLHQILFLKCTDRDSVRNFLVDLSVKIGFRL